jgi:rhodanese-related sulfurtransferase
MFEDIRALSQHPDPHRILIDVRETSELQSTGKIPSAQNLPVSTSADGFFLEAEEFEERFGFTKPGEEDEVVFYCKAGVRSRAAAQIAIQAGFGGKVGEFPGSWIEWAERGGDVEKVK